MKKLQTRHFYNAKCTITAPWGTLMANQKSRIASFDKRECCNRCLPHIILIYKRNKIFPEYSICPLQLGLTTDFTKI